MVLDERATTGLTRCWYLLARAVLAWSACSSLVAVCNRRRGEAGIKPEENSRPCFSSQACTPCPPPMNTEASSLKHPIERSLARMVLINNVYINSRHSHSQQIELNYGSRKPVHLFSFYYPLTHSTHNRHCHGER